MRRVLGAFLLAAIIGGLLVTPATARETHDCQMDPLISALRACVVHARDQGMIESQGVATSLMVKLDAAQAALDRGSRQAASNALQAFVRETTAQTGKHIDAAHAQHMVAHAVAVITALEA